MLNRAGKEESPWLTKFFNSAKKIAQGMGQMMGFCEKDERDQNKADLERKARQERNSTDFYPFVNHQKEKLERLSHNQEFQDLCKVSFADRLKQSDKLKNAGDEVEKEFDKNFKPKFNGETAIEIYSRRLSEIEYNEDLYSGFKPQRSQSQQSEGEDFYAQLWQGANSTAKKPQPIKINLAEFISNSQQKFHQKIGFNSMKDNNDPVGNWFKKDQTFNATSLTKTETNFSTKENTLTGPTNLITNTERSLENSPQPEYQYQISDVENSDQELDTHEVWKDEEDLNFDRSCSNSNTRLALKEEFDKVRNKFPNDPINDIKLFNKRSGLNLSQTEFNDLLKMKTPAKPKNGKKVLFINDKKVPEWARDMKAIGKEVIAQNTFGRYKQVFGKLKHIKLLDPYKFFRPELLRNYKRYLLLT